MKAILEFNLPEDQEEFDAIMAKQKPYYYTAFPEKDPSAAPADTTVVAAVVKNN